MPPSPIDLLRKILRFVFMLAIAIFLIALFLVATQDFHIFPGLYSSVLFGHKNIPPSDVEVLTTAAEDGAVVNIWRMRVSKTKYPSRKTVALLFHGNADHLDSFVQVQRWLKSAEISSYSVEYRGYSGMNSGWPSEKGFYADAIAAYELLKNEESLDSQDILVLGSSVGTGIAAYVAQKYQVGTLALLSPYTSLTDMVSDMPLYGYLAPFLKYRIPTSEFIELLTNTCVVTAHGKSDFTVPFHHSEKLKAMYHGQGSYILIGLEGVGHNDLLNRAHQRILDGIEFCVSRTN